MSKDFRGAKSPKHSLSTIAAWNRCKILPQANPADIFPLREFRQTFPLMLAEPMGYLLKVSSVVVVACSAV